MPLVPSNGSWNWSWLVFDGKLVYIAYLDDVIVFGRTFDEHLQRLSQDLSQFRQANLKVNLTKCQFFKKSVSFLGHVISHEGIETDPKKTEAVRNWPPPENIEELRSFLGLATYY